MASEALNARVVGPMTSSHADNIHALLTCASGVSDAERISWNTNGGLGVVAK
jgi:hypothetical protein